MLAGDADVSRSSTAFAQFNGWINDNQTEERLAITIAPENVSETDGKAYFGF